ncbi:EAL domain-containing protein [Heliorestis acidaminivorans]|uniref:Stage 0 sporulation protein A homolog n=1 Tax=Heliorestis acidaminivorans TaxID=553427 RepID=A0A6I0F323_9FIRM|nr:EAL domain-containing protein [Heliorestis acidaminivorans]KAB2952986.1 EAL domain-containing protein [Heliorestis acidaminivorans]
MLGAFEKEAKNMSVLYVEDERIIREQMKRLLGKFFADVKIAEDGEKGLAFYQDNPKAYDIVMTDISMPHMDGLEMIKAIKAINSVQHIIVLSAHNDADNLLKAIDLGVDHFMIKPVYREKFLHVIQKAVLRIAREREIKTIEKLYSDVMTGLPNRFKLLKDLQEQYEQNSPSLFLLNIDNFKETNDLFGYDAGDFVLVELSKRVRALLPDDNYNLYRIQGDEYAILINCSVPSSEYLGLVERILQEANDRPFLYQDLDIYITLSISVVRGEDGYQGEDIVLQANRAMNIVKEKKKSFLIYDPAQWTSEDYKENLKYTRMIKEALHNDKIILYYQPIWNNRKQKIGKYECLVRLVDEEGQVHGPFKFLKIAKKTKTHGLITRRVIEKSFQRFSQQNIDFSINLSVQDILDEDIVQTIRKGLIDQKIKPGQVGFEILESEGIENYHEVMKFIKEMKTLGHKISIDDFGMGYSNFNHIIQLNVDYLKLDSSLIKNIDQDIAAQTIVRSIVHFTKKLGIKTIAEFVHSEAVFNKVRELGIDFSQGYYIGKPSMYLMGECEN